VIELVVLVVVFADQVFTDGTCINSKEKYIQQSFYKVVISESKITVGGALTLRFLRNFLCFLAIFLAIFYDF